MYKLTHFHTLKKESKHMHSIEVTLEVSDVVIEDIIDGAGYAIGYWAQNGEHDTQAQTYTVIDNDDGEEYALSYEDIANAIQKLVKHEVKVRPDIHEAILLDIVSYENAHRMDTDAYDVIIQVACFDEVTYG